MRELSTRRIQAEEVSSPPVIGETQPIMRMVVDLPAPFGPRKPKTSPRRTSKSMPSTAVKASPCFLGNALTRPWALMRTSGADWVRTPLRRYPGRPTLLDR